MTTITQVTGNILKNGKKAQMIATLADGSTVELRKANAIKAFANVYATAVNGNTQGLGQYVTFNAKPGVTTDGETPIASFPITYQGQ